MTAATGPDAAVTLLRAGLPAWRERRVVALEPGSTLPYVAADWQDALVVVEHGSVVLDASGGARVRLEEGAVLCLAGLGLIALRNDGPGRAVVAGVRAVRDRRRDGSTPARSS